ncbi:MAG: vWA domain-containing protein [Phycisphaerae bacterium]
MNRLLQVFRAFCCCCMGIACAAGCWQRNPLPVSSSRSDNRPQAPIVQAGWHDDNLAYNAYLSYLRHSQSLEDSGGEPTDRLRLEVVDTDGKAVAGARIQILDPNDQPLAIRTTGADGSALWHPRLTGQGNSRGTLWAEWEDVAVNARWSAQDGLVRLALPVRIEPPQRPQLDLAIVLDTTGSMSDEIRELKQVLSAVEYQIRNLPERPDLRVGLVEYRDRGEAYHTRVTDLTGNLERIQKQLAGVEASGGGDKREDLQAGLGDMLELNWRPGAIKLAFVLGDAGPHLDYAGQEHYGKLLDRAGALGLRITTIGASGLDDFGERIFRKIAQIRQGRFVFLTYGETGDRSATGSTGVSHHTGGSFRSGRLDAILVHVAAAELAALGRKPAPPWQDQYFTARPSEGVGAETTLADLFGRAAEQLQAFSQAAIPEGTSVAVAQPTCHDSLPPALADAMGDRLQNALAGQTHLRLLERRRLDLLLDEADLSVAAGESKGPVEAGSADLLVISSLAPGPGNSRVDMFVRLVAARNGQILSATVLQIDPSLLADRR